MRFALFGLAGASAQDYPNRPVTVVVPFPAGGPTDAIIRNLGEAFAVAMADPAVRQRIADQGMEIPPPEQQTPEGFAVYLKAETDRWGAIIRESGITAQ